VTTIHFAWHPLAGSWINIGSLAKVKNAITAPSQSEIAPLLLESLATSGNYEQNDKDGDLRRSILVNCEAIQTHVSRLICDDEDDIATCLQ